MFSASSRSHFLRLSTASFMYLSTALQVRQSSWMICCSVLLVHGHCTLRAALWMMLSHTPLPWTFFKRSFKYLILCTILFISGVQNQSRFLSRLRSACASASVIVLSSLLYSLSSSVDSSPSILESFPTLCVLLVGLGLF